VLPSQLTVLCRVLCCVCCGVVCCTPQGQVQVKADKQIILEGLIQGITTIFFFGNQETKGQAPSAPLNMMEGSVIYCVPV
jgi:hypothetical protein